MSGNITLVVTRNDHQTAYYPASDGWRIDAALRCLVIGRGVPRTLVPLDGVQSIAVTHGQPERQPEPGPDTAPGSVGAYQVKVPCPRCGERTVVGVVHEAPTPTRYHCTSWPVGSSPCDWSGARVLPMSEGRP